MEGSRKREEGLIQEKIRWEEGVDRRGKKIESGSRIKRQQEKGREVFRREGI